MTDSMHGMEAIAVRNAAGVLEKVVFNDPSVSQAA